jgi:hypothetical protein
MRRTLRRLATAAALTLVPATGACATGGWDDVLHGTPSRHASEVTGEVRRVDERRRAIELRDDRGRHTWVRYDRDTRVVYRGRRYAPTALERGDFVTARVQRDRRGELYTGYVLVRRDARDRHARGPQTTVPGARRETLEGRVGRVQRNDGRFELRTGSRNVWVTLPYRPSGQVQERFRRLRQGDHVRVEGEWMNPQRFEVVRFR